MSVSMLIGIIAAVVGVLLCWIGWRRLKKRRVFAALQLETVALVAFVLAVFMFIVSSNLVVYHRLVYEQPVATVKFHQDGEFRYTARVESDVSPPSHYKLHGDEWQLDARILKWQGFANVLGLDAQYKLNRLSGRYTNIYQERIATRSIYQLSEKPVIDIWKLASDHDALFGWLIDAAYGSAVYLPMTDQAEYEITMSQSGLIARPVNLAAKQAVSKWVGL